MTDRRHKQERSPLKDGIRVITCEMSARSVISQDAADELRDKIDVLLSVVGEAERIKRTAPEELDHCQRLSNIY